MKSFNYHAPKDVKDASKLASSNSAFLAGGMTTIPSMKLGLASYKDVIDIKNKDGDMTLFPSYIFHYTTPHYSFKPRITIAFDLNLHKLHDNFIRL